jgi:protein-tyrosine phosphatase
VDRYRVCFVCMGNICRSPMAATVLSALLADAGLADRVSVESAGTGGWHAGDPADARALRTLTGHGYDGGAHRARQFDAAWFEELDLIVALDRDNLRTLRRMAPPDAEDRIVLLRSFDPAASPGDLEVPDPYYEGAAGFEHVYDLIEAACKGLVGYIAEQLG